LDVDEEMLYLIPPSTGTATNTSTTGLQPDFRDINKLELIPVHGTPFFRSHFAVSPCYLD
jgi:hypothetical protein